MDGWSLQEKVVLVTGGARGIGAATARLLAARGARPVLADLDREALAVTASLASFAHAPGLSAYAATKAGVEAMCNSLRLELAHRGVDVATIHPSWIDTDMVREANEKPAFKRLREAMRPPFRRTYPVER